MIKLHRLKGREFWLNHNLIETIEAGMDTILVLTNERKYVVQESADEIVEMINKLNTKIIRIHDTKTDDE